MRDDLRGEPDPDPDSDFARLIRARVELFRRRKIRALRKKSGHRDGPRPEYPGRTARFRGNRDMEAAAEAPGLLYCRRW